MGVLEDLFDVRGKAALVTGGASGLGYAFASILAECGANVTIADWDQARLETAGKSLATSSESEVTGVPLDVTDAAAVDACVTGIVKRQGSIDIVFANAGVARGHPP